MFEKVEMDYLRYGGKKGGLLKYMWRFLLCKGFRATTLYRIAHWCFKKRFKIGEAICARCMSHLCHCSIGATCEISGGLRVAHGFGLVIGGDTIIGKNCDVRQNITFGGNFNKKDSEGRQKPILGDNVSVGAGAVLVGPVKVGSNSIIGANAVVTKDIPENVIAAGVPAKIIKERWSPDTGRKL
ncbi:MAG: serine O-acetyltransferase [Nitrospinales bacterium]